MGSVARLEHGHFYLDVNDFDETAGTGNYTVAEGFRPPNISRQSTQIKMTKLPIR